MESIIRDHIAAQLNNSAGLSASQQGFTKGRSCATSSSSSSSTIIVRPLSLNLLTAFELWTKWIDEGFGVDIVYWTTIKRLTRLIMSNWLRSYLIQILIGSWLNGFQHFCKIEKCESKWNLSFSDWVAVLSGVPRGSVLGPPLFLIFINDLPLLIRNSMILMFADDTKISRKVSKVEDGFLLQQPAGSGLSDGVV